MGAGSLRKVSWGNILRSSSLAVSCHWGMPELVCAECEPRGKYATRYLGNQRKCGCHKRSDAKRSRKHNKQKSNCNMVSNEDRPPKSKKTR